MKQKVLATLIILVVVASFLPVFTEPQDVYAASANLNPSKDTYISGSPSEGVNHGTTTDLKVGAWTYGLYQERERTIIEFSEPWGSIIPDDSVITQVHLQLYYYSYDKASSLMPDPTGEAIFVQRLLRTGIDPWLEAHANWNRYIYGSNWDTAGAAGSGTDYTTAGQAISPVPASYGWIWWDVTDQVEAAQTADIDIAFRITAPTLETQGTVLQFYSHDYSDASYWPRLIINYNAPSAPTVGTVGADSVTYNSATCYGKIISEGSATPTIRGFKYGLSQTATWDIHESGSFGTGDYSLNLTGLVPDSTYYFRAYATNTYGTRYGSWQSFSTATGVPIVTTGSAYVYGYGCLYASMSGTITDTGLSTVFRRGFEWGTNPTTPEYDTYELGSWGTGDYDLTDFCGANTTYWFRAYAVNSDGTGYGVWKKFGTPEGPPDDCSGGGGADITGSGTPGDPYVIWTVDGLQDVQLHLSSYWELGCSINASATETWNWDAGRGVYEGFEPVGTFNGDFDGCEYAIDGLYINRSVTGQTSSWGVGLFRTIGAGGQIQDIKITNAHVEGYYSGTGHSATYSGGILAAFVKSNAGAHTEINYVFTSGTVDIESTVPWPGAGEQPQVHGGGVVGKMTAYGYLRKCASEADVIVTSNEASWAYAGGLVGRMDQISSYVYDCYARGSATAIGTDLWDELGIYTYAWAGGLAGEGKSIDNSYSTGVASATDARLNVAGGFVGRCENTSVSDSFWDEQTSGLETTCDDAVGKATVEMKIESTFTDAGWDFDTIWAIDSPVNDGYPYLQWVLTTPPEEATTYTLSLSSTAGGGVTTPGEGDFDYEYGVIVNLVATPDEGYRFALWVGDVTEVADTHSATTTVTVTDDFEIMAVFVPEGKLALYITSTDGGSVTDPGEGLFTYDPSDIVDLVASATGGYLFVMWTGDTEDITDVYDETTTITMLDDYAITANFATSGLYALMISSTDGGNVIIPGEGLFEYTPSAVVDLVAQPNSGAWFEEWTGDVGTIDDVYSAATNITISNNYSIVAEFGTSGTFDLTISSSVGGSVMDPGEDTFTYDAGEVVDLLAEADDGYSFFAWTGDTATIDDAVNADTTITMNGDCVIVANFEPYEECSLLIDVSPVEGGEITTPGQGAFTFPCGSLVTITAEAYTGWWFKEWMGDIDKITNPLSCDTTILMLDDYVITANFVEEEEPPEGAPSVTTLDATDIASSSAWLNGSLDSLGDYDEGYVFLQYGTTTSYGTNTREQCRTATGNFSSWINNLASNTTYHFRAVCRYGSYVYGEDEEFTTSEGETCADCLWEGIHAYESNLTGDDDIAMVYGMNWYGQTFTVTPESHSIVDIRLLVYRVGEPSTITVSIRECGDDGLPTGDDLTSGTFDGDSITNSTGGSWYGVTLTETNLAYDETYAICVRAEAGDEDNYLAVRIDTGNGYDGGQTITSNSGGIIWTAESSNDILFQINGRALIRVFEAKVFNSYLEDDDALIVLSYLNTYVPYYPDEIASLHFWLQLRSANGDTVLSQTVCQQWGYMPGSIYLNANQAASLTNGWPYRVYLAGNSAEEPVACYILSSDDWLGDALGLLPPWVLATANSMADYYGTAMTTQVQNNEVLNSEGGTLFVAGIPSLVITNPELFQDISYIPDSGSITPGPSAFDTSTSWEVQVGPVVARLANGLGGVMGDISGRYIIAAIFFIFYLGICYFVVRAKADPIIATFLCVPILLGVGWLRVIDFQLIAAVGAVAVIMTVYRFHWSRT
jgi:hypothetical protein